MKKIVPITAIPAMMIPKIKSFCSVTLRLRIALLLILIACDVRAHCFDKRVLRATRIVACVVIVFNVHQQRFQHGADGPTFHCISPNDVI